MSNRTFFSTRIGARQFEGVISADGPCICGAIGGVAIGPCTSIERLSPDLDAGLFGAHEITPNSWWIAKYRTQPRISLDGLRQQERQQLADEFGIRVGARNRLFPRITALI